MIERTEVVVTGGGPGGICAALAAARQGRKTALITDRPVLGGNSSSEIRVWTRGATGAGNIYSEEMGIWGEVKLRNLYLNPAGNPVLWDDVLLEQVLAEPDLSLYLNTHVTEVRMTDGCMVQSLKGFQMMTEKEIEFFGDYFIDATGDAAIGALAGFPYHMGKEGRDAYGESFAPVKEETTTFGSTLFYFTRREDHPVTYVAPDYAYPLEYVEELLGKGGRIVSEKMDGCDYWWFETGGTGDTILEAQDITLELKRFTAGVWNYIKNSGHFDSDCLTLEWEGNLAGKRESRRMLTKKVLTQQDVLEHRKFEDAAFYGGWYLDFHPSDGFLTAEDNCTQIPVEVYGIPLSCLYMENGSNLLFAGRDIGVSHVAFASTRIMNTCALSGQAAGTLAACCIEWGICPEKMTPVDVKEVQQRLIKDDMMIPGLRLMPEIRKGGEKNLAMEARVSASSVENQGINSEKGHFWLDKGGILIFPQAAAGTKFLLETRADSELVYECFRSAIPSRLAMGSRAGTMRLAIAAGRNWITLPIPDGMMNGFATLRFEMNEDVAFVIGDAQLTGFLLGSPEQPEYGYPCLQLPDDCGIYEAFHVINGYTGPWKEPNCWLSAPHPGGNSDRDNTNRDNTSVPWVRLSWDKPKMIKEICVFFNSDLSKELNSSRASAWDDHHKFLPRDGMPPELVKDAVLYGELADGSLKVLALLKDNWRRRWRIVLGDKTEVIGLRLEIHSTYGAKRAEIFEITVY